MGRCCRSKSVSGILLGDVGSNLRIDMTDNHCGKTIEDLARQTEYPLKRRWSSELFSDGTGTFRVFDWNILCPIFAYEKRYPKLPSRLLQWETRCNAIIQTILSHQPDIITLQEVTSKTFADILNALEPEGYNGIFFVKTDDRNDGVATFWKMRRFEKLDSTHVKFHLDTESLNKPQVALLVLLMDKTSAKKERILVSNTHLIFSIKRGDIKLGQLTTLTRAIWNVLLSCTKEKYFIKIENTGAADSLNSDQLRDLQGKKLDVLFDLPAFIMCGDFNFTPRSCLYQWLKAGDFNFSFVNNVTGRHLLSGQKFMEDSREHDYLECGHDGHGSSKNFDANDYRKEEARRPQSSSSYSGTTQWFDSIISSVAKWHPPCYPVLWVRRPLIEKIVIDDRTIKKTKFSSHNDDNDINLPNACSDRPFQSFFRRKTPECFLQHPLMCRSAYATKLSETELQHYEPAATAYHSWQKGCVDYVWFSINSLQIHRILEMPPIEILNKTGDIPNEIYPTSDHFHLIAEFQWKPLQKRLVPLLLPHTPCITFPRSIE